MTSTKKRDTMIGGTTYPPLEANVGGLTVTSPTPAVVLWNATARTLADTATTTSTYPSDAQRERPECFIRGLKESITVRTNSSNAWRWRRIVFTWKGFIPIGDGETARTYFPLDINGRQVMQRVAVALPFAQVAGLYGAIFRGLGINNFSVPARDWIDPITAPVDTERLTPLYDKVFRITSGNDSGVTNTYRIWHPVNKNIRYNDTEIGGNMTSSYFSTEGKPGCGDVYVMDIIMGNSSDEGDFLDWVPTATLYWHER